jgi:hypothetical protein
MLNCVSTQLYTKWMVAIITEVALLISVTLLNNYGIDLSVRKVVPTLTSNERLDLPLDGRC